MQPNRRFPMGERLLPPAPPIPRVPTIRRVTSRPGRLPRGPAAEPRRRPGVHQTLPELLPHPARRPDRAARRPPPARSLLTGRPAAGTAERPGRGRRAPRRGGAAGAKFPGVWGERLTGARTAGTKEEAAAGALPIPLHRHPYPGPRTPGRAGRLAGPGGDPASGVAAARTSDSRSLPPPPPPGAPTTITRRRRPVSAPEAPGARGPPLSGPLRRGRARLSPPTTPDPGGGRPERPPRAGPIPPDGGGAVSAAQY